jgi:HK97 family phage major capsid protein
VARAAGRTTPLFICRHATQLEDYPMKTDIKKLRQAREDKKAEGRRKIQELTSLRGEAYPSAEERERIAVLDAECEKLETEVTELSQRVEAEENAIMRGAAFAAGATRGSRGSRGGDPERTGGFDSLAEFAVAVRNAHPSRGGIMDSRLAAMYATPSGQMQELGGSAGEGYMVPAEYRDQVSELVFDEPDLVADVAPEPTSRNAVEQPVDESTPWGAAGIQAKWRREVEQMTPSKLATEGRFLQLHELYAFVTVTEELLQDAPLLNARLARGAARAISWAASDAIMWGTGVGQPLGWMQSGALVSVAKESGQAAATIVPANIVKMFSRLRPGAIARSRWYANSEILPQLMSLQAGDSGPLLWTPPATGFREAPGGILLGRPIVFSEHCKPLGTVGDLQLVDPSGYFAVMRRPGVQFAESMHLYFDYNLRAFRWTFRIGGMPFLSAPVDPAHGSTTKSFFTAIETRQ